MMKTRSGTLGVDFCVLEEELVEQIARRKEVIKSISINKKAWAITRIICYRPWGTPQPSDLANAAIAALLAPPRSLPHVHASNSNQVSAAHSD
ncbi:hypothetical protein LWI29_032813 [Acer saccharum]|uniref:Uncharacterized protein n=1 Tax=Acer saccharum TaxID=4024 RepID=A0AA39VE38_ACESA|nr:hypothetical protein LWI29_032813 [Acer saccharum]